MPYAPARPKFIMLIFLSHDSLSITYAIILLKTSNIIFKFVDQFLDFIQRLISLTEKKLKKKGDTPHCIVVNIPDSDMVVSEFEP